MTLKAFVLLSCLYLIALLASARPNFQPVSKFNTNKLVGVNWYEPFYADTIPDTLISCPREVYTAIGNGKIIAQAGEYDNEFNGELSTFLNIGKQVGSSGKFKIVDGDAPGGYAYILDYDKNYDWIVYGLDLEGDENDDITLITKTPENVVGVQRAVELAEKYEMNSHHLQLLTTKCDYDKIYSQLKKERKNIW